MIFKNKPYYDQKGMPTYILARISEGLRPKIPNEFNNSIIINLLNKCWNQEYKDRPTMNEVIKELKLIFPSSISSLNYSTSTSFTLNNENLVFEKEITIEEVNNESQYKSKNESLLNKENQDLISSQSLNSPIIKKKIAEMNVEEVCEWLLTLGLKNDYSSNIREENIQGIKLINFREDEWNDNFAKGDRAIIKKIVNESIN